MLTFQKPYLKPPGKSLARLIRIFVCQGAQKNGSFHHHPLPHPDKVRYEGYEGAMMFMANQSTPFKTFPQKYSLIKGFYKVS